MDSKKIGVGVGVMLLNSEDKTLLGKRHEDPRKANTAFDGEGTWTLPGGEMHFGESFRETASREVREETGIRLEEDKLERLSVTNDIKYGRHFVTIGFLCREFEGDAKAREPDRITKWDWFDFDDLPSNIFYPSEKMIKKFMAREGV